MRKNILNAIYITIAIVLLNVLSYFIFLRIDFTGNKRYSLSKVSKNIMRENKKPVTVDFYVTKDLPLDIKKLANEFGFLLKEYKSLSNVSFKINIIHPDNSQKEEALTNQENIIPFFKESREKDMEKLQRIYIGAVFHVGDRKFVIPQIAYNTPLEYEITRIIKQASETQKPDIGFIHGHGETSLTQMMKLKEELSLLTEISVVDLNKSNNQLNSLNVLCIIDPKESYTPYELEQLEQYLKQGGRLFIALNYAVGQYNSYYGYSRSTQLEKMLETKGLRIRKDFIVDYNCGTIAVPQPYRFVSFSNRISFPYFPLITNFNKKHIITQGMNSMLLPIASSIEQVKTQSTYIFTPLALSSTMSGRVASPVFFDLQKRWTQRDFDSPNNIVAALLDNEDNGSAMVVITDADFITDEIAALSNDNINFAINSIEWLADNSGLIGLRNKFITFSSLAPTTAHTREFLKLLNFLLPILAIIIIAIINFRKKQQKRINRSHPGYID